MVGLRRITLDKANNIVEIEIKGKKTISRKVNKLGEFKLDNKTHNLKSFRIVLEVK